MILSGVLAAAVLAKTCGAAATDERASNGEVRAVPQTSRRKEPPLNE